MGRAPRIGPWALINRWVGTVLWGAATVDALPLVPLSVLPEDSAPVRERAGGWGVPAALLVLAAAALATGGIAWRSTGRLAGVFAAPAETVTLGETRAALATAMDGAWWGPAYPHLRRRLRRLGEEAAAGAAPLRALAAAYESSRIRLDALGVPGRILVGPDILAPVAACVSAVRTPWHRQTRLFQEVSSQVDSYRGLADSAPSQLTGRVTELDAGHVVSVVFTDRTQSFQPVASTPALHDRFTVPLSRRTFVELTDYRRAGASGSLTKVDRTAFPLPEWPEGAVVFPSGGCRFCARFGEDWERRVPPLLPLSRGALDQLETDAR